MLGPYNSTLYHFPYHCLALALGACLLLGHPPFYFLPLILVLLSAAISLTARQSSHVLLRH